MKKLLVCVAVAGVAVGAIYLLSKTKKEEKYDSEAVTKEETSAEEQDTVQDMYVVKEKSAQSVRERHSEAAGIMTDAFTNIMKDVEPVELDKKSVEPVVDNKDVEIINELDSLSDELDELLK
ncbi:MAG: hypothetical protein RSC33_02035 [Vagococcus sp.]